VTPLVPVIGGDVRRRKLLAALAGLAVVVGAGVVVLWPRAERITRENYEAIRLGMTRAEVEAILGPPGDYATVPFDIGSGSEVDPSDVYVYCLVAPLPLSSSDDSSRVRACWCGNDRLIMIAYDGPNGGVEALSSTHLRKWDQSPLANLLWRARRQWHRWFPE
jgi:hypothetical protein